MRVAKYNCAPGNKNKYCLNLKQIQYIVDLHNSKSTNIPIANDNDINALTTVTAQNMDYFIQKLLDQYPQANNSIRDVFEILDTRKDEKVTKSIEDMFRPRGPARTTEWLFTDTINNVLNQYHNVYPDFLFLGTFPANCSFYKFCSLFSFNFAPSYEQGKRRFGIVFNTDDVGKPGSHWTSMFMSTKDNTIEFCDSTGAPPKEAMKDIMNKFIEFTNNVLHSNPEFKMNRKPYQTDSHSCGVYSCHFIISRLAGVSWSQYINKPPNKKEILQCRLSYLQSDEQVPDDVAIICDPLPKINV